jgi:hypothetical protein
MNSNAPTILSLISSLAIVFHPDAFTFDGGRFDIEAWKEKVSTLLYLCPHHRLINGDEIPWKIVPIRSLSRLNTGDKDSVTVLASITAAIEKLPLFIIANMKQIIPA